jgi:hypothetical protein
MDVEKEFQTIKEVVKNTILTDPRCADDDKWLIISVLRELGIKMFIDYKQLAEMPSFETITRCRRKLMEEGEIQPTKEVIDLREERREYIRRMFAKPEHLEIPSILCNRGHGVEITSAKGLPL